MSKKIFILIVALMSISLIGIIAVQVYWINDAIASKQKQFKSDVTVALAGVSEAVKEKEESQFTIKYSKFFENNRYRTDAEMKSFLWEQIDTTGREKFTFGATILEENFKIPAGFLNDDEVILKKYSGREDTFHSRMIKSSNPKEFEPVFDEKRFSVFKDYSNLERQQFVSLFNQSKRIKPINQRVRNRELNLIIKEELAKRNIVQEFKYGVYDDGLATSLKSGYFKIQPNEGFYYPLFEDENGNSNYKLYVTFPEGKKELLSGLMSILLLSIFFIFIIIVAFSSSLYQLIRQKKISEIKTDFINNMTHEFKTPIATINLALDAIKNPKIINDEEKVKRYVNMIREENKRMHGQVESVLRISRLEKNQLDISKEAVDVTDIIEDAIEHVNLLLQDRKGSIKTTFKAISTEALGNEFHLTNVVVNMLENALKYSEDKPKIEVITESTNKFFIFKIKDEGIGMSKQAQKNVFNKFYREQKGNIHDVKGHGLGLAYVKEIVENHHGTVFVESEKGKGSTFTVKLPLI